jgi:hypothetical protein
MLRLLVTLGAAPALLAAAACSDSHTTIGDGGAQPANVRDGAAEPGAAGSDAQHTAGNGAGPNAAGLSGFVAFNLAPDADCIYVGRAGSDFVPVGLYDLARRDDVTDHACDRPYVMHLLAMARRRPTGPPSRDTQLLLHSGSVTLITSEGETIRFDDGAQPLPNPFEVTTNGSLTLPRDGWPGEGVAAVEAIPLPYAAQLTPYIGEQIRVRVQLFGTTPDDDDLALQPFIYAIELCSGCLITCGSELQAASMTREDALGDGCADEAGADGRLCVEPGC